MNHEAFAAALGALGHPTRLAVFRLLARRAPGGVPASEIADAVGVAPTALSLHVDILTRTGLIGRERRGRYLLYRLDMRGAGALVDYLAGDCCQGRPDICAPFFARSARSKRFGDTAMTPGTTSDRPLNVLFICTGNSARSIFAEAILNRIAGGKFRAFSAGTHAYSELNPRAVDLLRHHGYDVSALRSKNVAEFQTPDAPAMDFVFTVCDRAANEDCPPWPGQPMTGHWGVPDPVKVEGTDAEKALAFSEAFRMLHHRISAFAALPFATLDRMSLQKQIDRIALDRIASDRVTSDRTASDSRTVRSG